MSFVPVANNSSHVGSWTTVEEVKIRKWLRCIFPFCFDEPKLSDGQLVKDAVQKAIDEGEVTIFSWTYCPYCKRLKHMLKEKEKEFELDLHYEIIELNRMDPYDEALIKEYLGELTGQFTVPNVFIGGAHVGGCDDTEELIKDGVIRDMLESVSKPKGI